MQSITFAIFQIAKKVTIINIPLWKSKMLYDIIEKALISYIQFNKLSKYAI